MQPMVQRKEDVRTTEVVASMPKAVAIKATRRRAAVGGVVAASVRCSGGAKIYISSDKNICSICMYVICICQYLSYLSYSSSTTITGYVPG